MRFIADTWTPQQPARPLRYAELQYESDQQRDLLARQSAAAQAQPRDDEPDDSDVPHIDGHDDRNDFDQDGGDR